MPYLARIMIHPLKALDGVEVSEAAVLPSGALENDRRFALVDATGKWVNGKRDARIHRLRSTFDARSRTLALGAQGDGERRRFAIDADREALHDWLADYFGFPVTIVENINNGFPDDLESPGPTVLSTATLEAVASWFPGLSLDDARLRFRANLEVGGVEPFWEDRLFADDRTVVRFQVGDVTFEGVNPCQRCVVPSRSPTTGETIPGFVQTFNERRQALLPPWTPRTRFNHFYRLAVNTRPSRPSTGTLRTGDLVVILGPVPRVSEA